MRNMFIFHWSELLVLILGGIILFLGLALMMLRRRNEILQTFLTPEEPDLEDEFFREHLPKQEVVPEETAVPEKETGEEEMLPQDGENAQWGTPLENS